jgi:2-polyprenyl-3-methyl-5-hydroxy-6-metoxy-1,4-benzoquinol methylase
MGQYKPQSRERRKFGARQVHEFITPDDKTLNRRVFRQHISRYYFAAPQVVNGVVLDIATGCGYGAAYLHHKGAAWVIGGDVSSVGLTQAKRYYQKRGVEFVLMDAAALPFTSGVLDAIVSLETIEHLARPDAFLKEIVRVLRPNGVLVLSTPNKDVSSPGLEKPLWPFHVQEFQPEELRVLISQFFRDVDLYGLGRTRPRSTAQTNWREAMTAILGRFVHWLPAGNLLLKIGTAFFMRDLSPVDITTAGKLEAAAGWLGNAYRLNLVDDSVFLPRDLLVMASGPREEGANIK